MNIIVTGAPRSGTSITAAMLNKLGWNFPADANWGGESLALEKFQKSLLQPGHQAPNFKGEQQFLNGLKEPWIVKSPSFCLNMKFWEIFLELPILIVVRKDFNKLMESWARLEGKKMHKKGDMFYANGSGISCREWHDQGQVAFDEYQGQKMIVHYDKVIEAVKMFDLGRSSR